MLESEFDIIIIGGSAGSMPVLVDILQAIPNGFRMPVVIVLHRLKNVGSDLGKLLAEEATTKKVIEPDDKQPVLNQIYLAPQNYHLLAEEDRTFSLDYSELVYFSRPSIDVSFGSFSKIYSNRTIGILLSGANKDGAEGLKKIKEVGGMAIVQQPSTAQYPTMPQAAINLIPDCNVYTPEEIVQFLTKLQ